MKPLLFLLPCLFLLLPVHAAEESSKELLRDGLFEEEVNQDYKKAEAAYRSVTERYDEERRFAGLAFFRLAEIARKSGNQEQAAALYRRVAGEFAELEELAKRARTQLGEDDEPNLVLAAPDQAPVGNAEALELRRLQKMERDSPDLLNGVGEDGWHPLHKAAASGWTNAVAYLLERNVSVDPRTTSDKEFRTNGYTPLHLAVIHGHLTVVDQLLTAKADPGLLVSLKPEDLPLPVQSIPGETWGEWSALHFSVLYQRREILTRLLTVKAPLNAGGPSVASYEPSTDSSSRSFGFEVTPLILSVWLNDMVAFQVLMDHGADINQTASENGETALLAAVWNHPKLVPVLLEKGARVSSEPVFGRTILHWAIEKCPPLIIQRLIGAGADVNARVTINRHSYDRLPTPLELVFRSQFTDEEREVLIDALMAAGAKPTARALMSAVSRNYIRVVRSFMEAGADPNGSVEDGDRPLHWVKQVEAARILIAAGARLEAKNHEGTTPFGNAIRLDDTAESRELIDYLLAQGADASVIPVMLRKNDPYLAECPLLPYVMSKTEMVGKSDPKAITLAFPRNWMTMVGDVQVLPGTPAPSLHEVLCLNYQYISATPGNQLKSSSGRSVGPRVVTDLIIYRPNDQGELVEVARLADQSMRQGPPPALQWGDIVALRFGKKSNDGQHMPIIHHVNGLEPKTVTFKSGPWEHKVVIENTPAVGLGLSLGDHLPPTTTLVDSEKIVLRRGEESILMGPAHDRAKIRLMDGDVIEFSLNELDHPFGAWDQVQVFFPDRPSFEQRSGARVPMSELLFKTALPGGRDFSKVEIQRHSEEGMKRIPVDLLAISRESLHDEATVAKALELLQTLLQAGDVVVFPPLENVPWAKRCSYDSAASPDSPISAVVNLVKPEPPSVRRSVPRPTSTKPSTSRTNGRRVVLPPSSR